MYTYENVKEIEKELKRFLLFFATATAIFIIIIVAVCKNWGTQLDPYRLPVWPAYLTAVLYAVGTVFSWSFIGMKIIKYRRYVYNILTGLDHKVMGEICAVNKSVVYDNDLEFYSIEIKEADDEENRQLYLDAQKDIDFFEVGKNVELKVFGNYIKDILS